jgi:hypothetical protein
MSKTIISRWRYPVAIWSISLVLVGAILLGQNATDIFPEVFERLDFVATDQQAVFNTKFTPRSNVVIVFLNGILQTQELNPTTCTPPACADYTSAAGSGKQVITFLTPRAAGDRVALLYWR